VRVTTSRMRRAGSIPDSARRLRTVCTRPTIAAISSSAAGSPNGRSPSGRARRRSIARRPRDARRRRRDRSSARAPRSGAA
jgi:hypothetical protein